MPAASARTSWSLTAAVLLATGCGTVSPRFDPAVQRSFVEDEMRRMETEALVVYYPAHAKETVVRIVARLQQCAGALLRLAKPESPRDKLVVLITSSEFNNAYVQGRLLGTSPQMVLPLQMGAEIFNFFDLGVANIGDVACHEAVHYVQLEQIDGFWRYVNLVFGEVVAPNVGTESWFLEGLATWFEGDLGRPHGRPHSPLWTAAFRSGVAAQGTVETGQLSFGDREQLPLGGNYLTGSHFVGWLARTYGEEKLWELVDKQGRSLFFPLGVTLRFRSVFGQTIGALVETWEAELVKELGTPERPPGQNVLIDDAGYMARLAAGPDGSLALIWVGLDTPSTLEVREPDGRTRFRVPLTRVAPERPWILAGPGAASGLSFTRDGSALFFLAEDLDIDGESVYALRKFDARTGAFLQQWTGLRGLGGDVTPDGQGYVYVEIREGAPALTRLDLRTGERAVLSRFGIGASVGGVAISPDGTRIAFSFRSPETGWDLHLREADGSVRSLTNDGRFNYGARWLDDETLVLAREVDGTAQLFTVEAANGKLRQATSAPFAAFEPAPLPGGKVAFLNREGWRWSVDEVSVPVTVRVEAPLKDEVDTGSAGGWREATTASTSVKILEDEPYSPLDSLFIPRLRIPYALIAGVLGNEVGMSFRLALTGYDRLGYFSWAIHAIYVTHIKDVGGTASVSTGLLAPWYLEASINRDGVYSRQPSPGEGYRVFRRTDHWGAVLASRPLWTSFVGLGVQARLHTDREETREGVEVGTSRLRLLGPTASFSWAAGESTAYAGTVRGLSTSLSLSAYPRALGSSYDLADARATFGAWIPLPGLDRDSFAVSLRLHSVPGPVPGLLQVGGVGDLGAFIKDAGVPSPEAPGLQTVGLTFTEPLRGFEDVSFRATSVAVLGARYRYPFIIDRGITSVLWLLPSFFWRQVELEAFVESARTDVATQRWHTAVGLALRSRHFWAAAPFSVYVQAAHRFDPGLGTMVLVGLSLD